MSTQILTDEVSIKKVKRGLDIASDLVKSTLGIKGRNVMINTEYENKITDDGITILESINLKDNFENAGVKVLKKIAKKTNDFAGDGTTTSTILAQAILNEGIKYTTRGVNVMQISRSIEKASSFAIDELRLLSKPVIGEQITQVATISAKDTNIGQIIGNIINEIGKDADIKVEESQTFGITYEIKNGFNFDKGYISPFMVTNRDKMEAVFEDTFIAIIDKKLKTIDDVTNLLQKMIELRIKDIVLIVDDIEGDALNMLIANRIQSGFNVLAIKSPGFSDNKKDWLEDIACSVGATVISEEKGMSIKDINSETLGKAKKIITSKGNTTIIEGKGNKKDVKLRLKSLKERKKEVKTKYEIENIDRRISNLFGKVGIIKVGTDEISAGYLRLKIEDAINATHSAIEEGIIAGGGSALAKVSKKLEDNKDYGFQIMSKVLKYPIKQIVVNSGREDGDVIANKIIESKHKYCGFDAKEDRFVEDMIKEGIIDPFKVVRACIENSATTISKLLTLEGVICEEQVKENIKPNYD